MLAVRLHFELYNFCRIQKTLRVTPTREAGIDDHVRSMEEVVMMADTNTGNRRLDRVPSHRFGRSEGSASHAVGFSFDVIAAPFEEFIGVYDDLHHVVTQSFALLDVNLEPTKPGLILGLETYDRTPTRPIFFSDPWER